MKAASAFSSAVGPPNTISPLVSTTLRSVSANTLSRFFAARRFGGSLSLRRMFLALDAPCQSKAVSHAAADVANSVGCADRMGRVI
jgi:hypothetical protein